MTAGLWLAAAVLLAELARYIAESVRRYRSIDAQEFPSDPRKAARLSHRTFEDEDRGEFRLGLGYGLRAAAASAALVAALVHTVAGPAGISFASLAALGLLTAAFAGVAQLGYLLPALAVMHRASLSGALPGVGLVAATGVAASGLAAAGIAVLGWLRPLPAPRPAPAQAAAMPALIPDYRPCYHARFSFEIPVSWSCGPSRPDDSARALQANPVNYAGAPPVLFSAEYRPEGEEPYPTAERYVELKGAGAAARRSRRTARWSVEELEFIEATDPDRYFPNSFTVVTRHVVLTAGGGYYVLKLYAPQDRLGEVEPAFYRFVESFEPRAAVGEEPALSAVRYRIGFVQGSRTLPEGDDRTFGQLIDSLHQYPSSRLHVLGYAAASEPDASGLAVGRAEAVTARLVTRYSIDPARISIAGMVVDEERSEVEVAAFR